MAFHLRILLLPLCLLEVSGDEAPTISTASEAPSAAVASFSGGLWPPGRSEVVSNPFNLSIGGASLFSPTFPKRPPPVYSFIGKALANLTKDNDANHSSDSGFTILPGSTPAYLFIYVPRIDSATVSAGLVSPSVKASEVCRTTPKTLSFSPSPSHYNSQTPPRNTSDDVGGEQPGSSSNTQSGSDGAQPGGSGTSSGSGCSQQRSGGSQSASGSTRASGGGDKPGIGGTQSARGGTPPCPGATQAGIGGAQPGSNDAHGSTSAQPCGHSTQSGGSGTKPDMNRPPCTTEPPDRPTISRQHGANSSGPTSTKPGTGPGSCVNLTKEEKVTNTTNISMSPAGSPKSGIPWTNPNATVAGPQATPIDLQGQPRSAAPFPPVNGFSKEKEDVDIFSYCIPGMIPLSHLERRCDGSEMERAVSDLVAYRTFKYLSEGMELDTALEKARDGVKWLEEGSGFWLPWRRRPTGTLSPEDSTGGRSSSSAGPPGPRPANRHPPSSTASLEALEAARRPVPNDTPRPGPLPDPIDTRLSSP